MLRKKVIHALIPARGGSKSIPRKNVRIYKDIPLLVHSIKLAKTSEHIDEVVVSTDDEEIKRIALENGAYVPFLRPKDISGDFSTDHECFLHYLRWLKFAQKEMPDILIHLRPTYPERSLTLLNDTISKFLQIRNEYTSLRTVVPLEKTPFKTYIVDNNVLVPLFPRFKNIKEPYNQVRQILPQTYHHNGCIDITNTHVVLNGSMTGSRIYPYIMEEHETLDIDTEKDWDRSLNSQSSISVGEANSI